jgi:hypothetical protein
VRVRYVGPDESRDVAMSSGAVRCPKGEWVDLVAAAVASGIPEDHAVIVAAAIADAPDWETEPTKKPAKGKEQT